MREFARGQKSKLSDLTSATELTVSLDVQAAGSPDFDISCFGVDADGKLSDDRYFVFYNQKQSPEGEIEALGAQNGDREAFRVNLAILPQKVQKLVFTVTLDGAGTMSQVSRGHLRLLSNGSEVARFPFTGADFSQEKAVIVGEIYRKDVWRFAAVGQGFNGGLSALLQHFGGQEIEDTALTPPPPVPPPPAAPKVNISKITLDKKGDKQVVDLKKGGGARPIHINLNWDASAGGGKRGI
ncbi:MAG: TerD family protein, partial [Rubrobacter sp.]|nr:TerD family protein [Rubrobacter sp.]